MTNEPKTVYLWLLSQSVNNGYDTYDSAVVAARTEDEARHIYPGGHSFDWATCFWASPDHVVVQRIGIADESVAAGTVVCASFNAG